MPSRREYLQTSALLVSVGLAGCGSSDRDRQPTTLTGATTSPLTVSPRRKIDIRDKGAAVDGKTDDRRAIQAAIDEAEPGDTVYIPAGTTSVAPIESNGPAIELDGENASGLTIQGTGPQSVVTFLDDSVEPSHAWLFGMDLSGPPIEGLVIEDLVLDGNRANNPRFTTIGINQYPGGTDHDVTIRNVLSQNCSETGFSLQGGKTLVSHCTAINNGRHGFRVRPWIDTEVPEVVLKDVLTVDNGGLGIDHSSGVAFIDGFWAENNDQGGAKVPWPTKESTWRKGTFSDNGTMGFRFNGDYQDQHYRPFTIHLDNVVAVDNPWSGFWLAGDVDYDIGTIAAVRNNTSGHQQGNIDVLELAEIGADTVYSLEANGPGLFYSSPRKSQITNYYHNGNQNGALSGDALTRLIVENESNDTVLNLDIPDKAEIGAWASP